MCKNAHFYRYNNRLANRSVCGPRPASHAHFRHRQPSGLNSIDIPGFWPNCVWRDNGTRCLGKVATLWIDRRKDMREIFSNGRIVSPGVRLHTKANLNIPTVSSSIFRLKEMRFFDDCAIGLITIGLLAVHMGDIFTSPLSPLPKLPMNSQWQGGSAPKT